MRGRPKDEAFDLLARLKERGKRLFKLETAIELSRKTANATTLVLFRLARSGLILRVDRGLYALAAEPGEVIHKLAVGQELADQADSYISHGSAMEVHGMLDGPWPGPVIVSLKHEKRMRARTALGVSYQFVSDQVISERRLWGKIRERPAAWMVREVALEAGEPGRVGYDPVRVSDPEWTIMGGLARPELCGGVRAVAKGLAGWRERLDLERLVQYAIVVKNRTACRRLGFLLDELGMQTETSRIALWITVLRSYRRLEPANPWSGDWDQQWKLDVNG